VRDLANDTFRANRSYDLVLRESLAPMERAFVNDLEPHAGLYGCFRPNRGSGLEWRSATSDTALLFFTLRVPGPIPAYMRASLGAETDMVIARLVLDGVLEIEQDGVFRSGPTTIDALFEPRKERELGAIARRSVEALQYGQTLDNVSVEELAMRLYQYGRKPLSPAWNHRLSSVESVVSFLGLGDGGPARASLDMGWIENRAPGQRFWRSWTPRESQSEPDAVRYKLYVSPACESLPCALLATIETLSNVSGVQGLKVGRDLAGLCRPDKLVAYFSRLEALQVAARELHFQLKGIPPHGVPFTSEVTRDGLLSWGVDPPVEQRRVGAQVYGSWRLWVANRLAEYLLVGKAQPTDVAAWRFALDRLRADGLDTDTWVPVRGLWSQPVVTS